MDFIRNFPFFSIIICMFSGILSSVLSGKKARNLCIGAVSVVMILSACVLWYTVKTNTAFTYMMGHFPAPWGNEIRAGILEGVLATIFSVVLLLSQVWPSAFFPDEELLISLPSVSYCVCDRLSDPSALVFSVIYVRDPSS